MKTEIKLSIKLKETDLGKCASDAQGRLIFIHSNTMFTVSPHYTNAGTRFYGVAMVPVDVLAPTKKNLETEGYSVNVD